MSDLSGKKRLEDGVSQVTIEDAPEGTNLVVVGRRFEVTLDSDTNGDTKDDWTLTEQIEMQGVVTEVANHTDGDYIELRVIMPGDPEVEISYYAQTIYVKPSGQTNVIATGTATVPAGLIIRASYHSVATSGPQPIVYMDFRIWK